MAQRTYSQLSLQERDRLAVLRARGLSIGAMSRRLQRSKSTISRELRRNRGPTYCSYGAGSAQRRAHWRKKLAARRPRLKNQRIRTYVRAKLHLGWSPEQIDGRLPTKYPGLHISHEAIYQYIYQPNVRKQENLVPYLPRAHRRRQEKGHRHTHRDPHIPERISIWQRPAHILKRAQLGHWENDTVTSRKSLAVLNVIVERKTRFTKITKLKRRTARNTRCAITKILSHYPAMVRRTITYDNGKENVEHRQTNAALGTKSFFCEPFHSWEKGTVENTVGLVRRTFPKKTDFDLVTTAEVKRLERRLNNRPRKSLHFKTPKEVFKQTVALAH